jgi:hypothetical protein
VGIECEQSGLVRSVRGGRDVRGLEGLEG